MPHRLPSRSPERLEKSAAGRKETVLELWRIKDMGIRDKSENHLRRKWHQEVSD